MNCKNSQSCNKPLGAAQIGLLVPYLSELPWPFLAFCIAKLFLVGVNGLTVGFLTAGGDVFGRLPPLEKSEPRGENFFERIGDLVEMMRGDAAELNEESWSCSAFMRLCGGVCCGLDMGAGRKLFSLLHTPVKDGKQNSETKAGYNYLKT